MSLGTGALNVGRAPAKAGGIHGNPMSRNHPCKQLPTGTVTLNRWRSASIREDLREHAKWSARTRKDLQQEQQLMCKGSYKPRLVIRYDQHNQTICKHASKEPCQRRGGAKRLRPPTIKSQALWGYPLTPQNATCN